MYRLLIADDEELIRKGIISRLDYLGLVFEDIYEASTGLEALEILETKTVDIAITDIRMPDMDGLAFISEARKRKAGIKFIILSGYAEFDYAEEAIRLGVKRYLLKPVSNEDLRRVIIQLENQLAEEEGTRRAMSLQNKLIMENQTFTLDREVNSILSVSGKDSDFAVDITENEVFKNLRNLYPKLFSKKPVNMCLVIISIERKSYANTGFRIEDMDLIKYAIKNVFQEIKTSCSKFIVENLTASNQLYAVLGDTMRESVRGEVERVFLKMLDLFEEELGVYLTFGVSGIMNGLCSEMQQQADDALKGKLINRHSNIYFYDDMEMVGEISFSSTQLNMLNQYLEKSDINKVRAAITDIFGKEKVERYHIHYIRIMWVRVLNLIFRNFSLEMLENENAEMLANCFSAVNKMGGVEELIEHYMDIVTACIGQSKHMDTNARGKINLAVSYIDKHYDEDISINKLAEKYNMSPNYFSSLFKKEMKKSAVNYIAEVRMNRAMKFLMETDRSVVEIAKAVGYEESHYFYRVFKKTTGMTPIKYRETNKRRGDSRN